MPLAVQCALSSARSVGKTTHNSVPEKEAKGSELRSVPQEADSEMEFRLQDVY